MKAVPSSSGLLRSLRPLRSGSQDSGALARRSAQSLGFYSAQCHRRTSRRRSLPSPSPKPAHSGYSSCRHAPRQGDRRGRRNQALNTLGQSTNKQFEKLYEDLFKKYHDVEPQEIPDSAWYPHLGLAIAEPDAVRTFVATQIAEGRWSPLEVVARTVSVSVATAKGAVGAIMGFDLAQTALLVDIEEMKNPPQRGSSEQPTHGRQLAASVSNPRAPEAICAVIPARRQR